ncbi:hypothetical protein TNCV_973591 [Trichonephila clavipes]|nr:hypothetical protein TNCV_973591 [Trichonephila clavipes]
MTDAKYFFAQKCAFTTAVRAFISCLEGERYNGVARGCREGYGPEQHRKRTVFEAKGEESEDDDLIYAASLQEELEISFEPQDKSGGSKFLAMEVKMFSYRTQMT